MTLSTSDLEDILFDGCLLGEVAGDFYAQGAGFEQVILKKMNPNLLNYPAHDTYYAMMCPDTHWQLEYCYHSVGECMELRDREQTFRVVFRLKQEMHEFHHISGGRVETYEEWEHWYVIDRIDGRDALGRYLMTWKLSQ
ncbi:hypothetical protein [Ensifer sp. SL37]|uniref:hypothetical protein n=1 Tax=Ensifer sp. SL37 TaxID=2995137 RepID=UPI0022764CF1|nr:hypothetical protein [Ensifer sp. SL37]MCY1741431.1 hypothetical protein [Ensifer sp. SL37]